MILPVLTIAPTSGMGRGVFTGEPIEAGTIIEVAPVIVLSAAERAKLEQTLLFDYIFEWGKQKKKCCVALGYVSIYNHSYTSNCEYEMDFTAQTIAIKTVRKVAAGEELFINYNGDADDKTPLWFKAQ
jgi:SET domain-containing protein